MTDETKDKKEEKVVEVPKEEPKEEGYDYAKDHNKDIRTIIHESIGIKDEQGVSESVDKVDASLISDEHDAATKSNPKKEDPVVNPLDEAKRYLEEQRKQDALEFEKKAKETAREEVKRTKEQETQEAKELEDLKPSWEKEGRAPKDYAEIAAENRRITKLELKREAREEKQAQELATKAAQETQVKQQQTELETINSKINQDMEDLYSGGYLTRPDKPGDPNDPGEKVKAALFKLGVDINLERKQKGLAPEPSIAKIFFMNKDKLFPKAEQPAGGDAPVAGARPAVIKQEPEGYNYRVDHNKSYRQIMAEAAKKSQN